MRAFLHFLTKTNNVVTNRSWFARPPLQTPAIHTHTETQTHTHAHTHTHTHTQPVLGSSGTYMTAVSNVILTNSESAVLLV